MTDEEIEQKIAAEVDRRIGGMIGQMVGQIGKDLADRYATKEDVDKAIEARIRREAQALNIALLDIVNRLKKDEKVPDTHPLAVVFQIMEEISDLEFRVMELGIFVVATQQLEDVKHSSGMSPVVSGPAHSRPSPMETLERMEKLTVLKQFMAEREHGRIHAKTEKAAGTSSDAETLALQFVEILGSPPQENQVTNEKKPQEREEKFPGQKTPGGWRPDDYLQRTPQEQWRIDDRLGILDWDGTARDR